MPRQQVLRFIEDYYDKEGRPPSIRAIAKKIAGVSKTNFYDLFPGGINEALNLLGIEGKVEGPTEALEARRAKSETGFRIILNEAQTRKLLGIAFLEGKDESIVLDEMLDNQREIRGILEQVGLGAIDTDTIHAILNPTQIYKKWNVSEFSHMPWFTIRCRVCGKDIFYGEALTPLHWTTGIKPNLRRFFKCVHEECKPKRPMIIRIPA